MKHSSRMASLLKKITGVDFSTLPDHVTTYHKFVREHYMPLVVESFCDGDNRRMVSVAHYFEQNGDLCQDPEIVFWVQNGYLFPVEETMACLGYRRLVEWRDGKLFLNRAGQADVASFANIWSTNLRQQGFDAKALVDGRASDKLAESVQEALTESVVG